MNVKGCLKQIEKELWPIPGRPDTPVGLAHGDIVGRPDTPVGLAHGDIVGRPDTLVGRAELGCLDEPVPDKSVRPTGEDDGPGEAPDVVDSSLWKRRHHLPHWQQGGSVYFITFRSARGQLPAEALREVTRAIEYDAGRRYDLYLAVAMPDHVHMLIQPREKNPGVWYDLSETMKAIKGVSARRINQLFGTSGTVWQQESFDRIVRDDAEFLEKWNYMLNNPVKTGLVENQDDYEHIVIGRPDTPVGQTQTSVSHVNDNVAISDVRDGRPNTPVG